MIALSGRHVPLLLGLAMLLLFPLARARFDVQRVDDCAQPDALRDLGHVPGGMHPQERWEKYDVDLRQWTLVDLLGNDRGMKLQGALLRSYKASDLYSRPPRFLVGGFEAGDRKVDELLVGDDVLPIQTIRDATHGRNGVISWLFVYQGRPVRHPILAQLASAPQQLWSGTRPLTLLIAGGSVARGREDEARERTTRWLARAFEHQRDACAAQTSE